MPWRRGIRTRLAVVLVALVGLTAAVLGIGASVVADVRLHAQALTDAEAQARFDLSVTVPGRQLPADPTADDIDRSGLADTFQQRGVESIVEVGGGGLFVSIDDLAGLLDRLPADMRARIAGGELAYAWSEIAAGPVLVVGGRPAGSTGAPTFYFVHDATAIRDAVDQLRLALAAGALILVLVALAAARAVARGVLAPVEEGARAAERIRAGDLGARVPVGSADEFGAWADAFNRMAATLQSTIASLEAAQDQNRRFVADVAHELRTPLTALVAEASIVGANLGAMPLESRRAAELLVGDVQRLRVLVEELMELSRFDAGAEHVALETVDVGRFVRAVIAARLPTARFASPEPALVVESDPRRLERIVGNLLDNAREHAPAAEVTVSAERRDDDVVITVADRGPGVPADRLERIFERFSKLDPSRSGGSSGLGLAIAAEHAALLGGYLQASARPGGGLAIEVVLPVAPDAVTRSLPDGDGTVMSGRDSEALDPSSQERQP